jgi:hypothetical protein
MIYLRLLIHFCNLHNTLQPELVGATKVEGVVSSRCVPADRMRDWEAWNWLKKRR